MSLFSDSRYQYRETFFVLFQKDHLPSPDAIQEALQSMGSKYETVDVRLVDGRLESLTVRSPYDFSAMDITYTEGEEVITQIQGLQEDMRTMTLSGDDLKKLQKIKDCDARFDIFHFEEVAAADAEDAFLDPGGLLLVLEHLAGICHGVSIDPQSQTIL